MYGPQTHRPNHAHIIIICTTNLNAIRRSCHINHYKIEPGWSMEAWFIHRGLSSEYQSKVWQWYKSLDNYLFQMTSMSQSVMCIPNLHGCWMLMLPVHHSLMLDWCGIDAALMLIPTTVMGKSCWPMNVPDPSCMYMYITLHMIQWRSKFGHSWYYLRIISSPSLHVYTCIVLFSQLVNLIEFPGGLDLTPVGSNSRIIL